MPLSAGMNVPNLSYIAVFCYFVSGLGIGLRLFSHRDSWRPSRNAVLGIGFLAILVHAAVLYQVLLTDAGVNLGFFNAVSLVSWTIVVLLLASALTKPVDNLGIVLLPLAAITLLLDLRYPSINLLSASSPWELRAHILVSLLAYSLLTLASVQAILLAIQDYQLHKHHPGGFIRALPPLQTMENLLFEMIAVGFVLLSLTLVTGFLFLEDMFAQRVAHKTILSILAWLVFGTLLWGRYKFGWRGRIAIRWTLVGFVVLMLAYFGSKAVVELILQN